MRRSNARWQATPSSSPARPPRLSDDYDYPFKPNPHFVSWLPLTEHPFCYIVYTPGHRPKLIYYQARDYWHVAIDPGRFLDGLVRHRYCIRWRKSRGTCLTNATSAF